MEKTLLLKLFKSLFITLIVSGSISYFLTYAGIYFLPSFILFTVIQFLFFYFYGEYVNKKNLSTLIEAETRIFKEKQKQSTIVVCPCDRKIETTIPINLDKQNSYICPGCDKKVSVFVETKTALSTEPVDMVDVNLPIIYDRVEKLLKTNENR